MTTAPLDAALFDEPVRVFPLGYVVEGGNRRSLVLGNMPQRQPKGFTITEEVDNILSTLNPAQSVLCSEAEAGVFATLAQAGIVDLVPAQSSVMDIDLVAVAREQSVLEVTADGGYQIRLAHGEPIPLSPVGLLWLHNNNLHQGSTIGEVSRMTKSQLLASSEDKDMMYQRAGRLLLSADSYFESQVFELLGTFVSSGLGTFERVVQA